MKITVSWIKDFLDTKLSTQELADQLSMLGLVVDEIIDPAESLKDFVIAEVLEAEQHPNADRLKVCKVNTGKETLQVVCGAPNARAGIKVVFAPVGSCIPSNGMTLKKSKIRDVESHGMMCSAQELELGEDSDGIIELAEDAPVGEAYAPYAGLDDPVFDIEITPDRGDCLGAYGLARDLAAAGAGTLKAPNFPDIKGGGACSVSVSIETDAKDACSLFTGRTIKGVKNGPSPQWMQQRLTAVGLRPISALVDITNYLSYSFGRPMHAFDLDKLSGDVHVRMAKDGEKIAALNDCEYTLDNTMTVVADSSTAAAVAGIVGGEATGCMDETTNVFLESAVFDPIRTAMTGRKLNVITDSRYRFERSVDRAMVEKCLDEATQFILDHCGGTASQKVIVGQTDDDMPVIAFDTKRVKELVNLDLSDARIKEILESLGFVVDSSWNVTVPSWRHDVTRTADLVEEVCRIHGYDEIPVELPPMPKEPNHFESYEGQGVRHQRLWAARRTLAARGLSEAMTWSFLQENVARLFGGGDAGLKLVNPISADLSDMRPSLLPNLIQAVKRNSDRGFPNAAFFEVGSQFKGTSWDAEETMVTGVRSGEKQGRHWDASQKKVTFYDAKQDALAVLEACGLDASKLQIMEGGPDYYHPGRCGKICQGPKNVLATFGELHPKVMKDLDCKDTVVGFEVFAGNIPVARKAKKKPLSVSAFQPVDRDFAFIVEDSVKAGDLLQAVRKADKDLICAADVFDIYQGKGVEDGHKSLAVNVTLQPVLETLSEEDLNTVSNKIIQNVEKAVGGKLRQ